jgi:chemotaxis protein CheX
MVDSPDQHQFAEAVEAVWSTLLELKTTLVDADTPRRARFSSVTGCIQVTGAWQGAVTVDCSGALARRVASIMFGQDAVEVTSEQIRDAIGELTNIIGGHIKSLLPGPSQLSLPAVTEGTDYFFNVVGSRTLAKLDFSCDDLPFQVTVLEGR